MSLLRGGAYTRDKNTSVRVCAKNAGGAYVRGGGVFVGHYGTNTKKVLNEFPMSLSLYYL